MDRKNELYAIFTEALGSANVYYNPLPSISMKYPAIKYGLDNVSLLKADNTLHNATFQYQGVIISKSENRDIIKKLMKYPQFGYDRHYIADNLHHDVFTIY